MATKTHLKHLSDDNKLLIVSLLVGLCSGLAAAALKYAIAKIQTLTEPLLRSVSGFDWRYFVFPAIGMFLSWLIIRFIIKDKIGHGVTRVLLAVSRNESAIKPHNMWSSVVTSALTIGFGGSVGAEAPIVYTGAAFGSNLGRLFKLSSRSVKVLVGCGAAGAVAGIFKAPLAGILFTFEILLFNISMGSMMPLLIATVSSTMVAYILGGLSPMFTCSLDPFSFSRVPYYMILGVFCAFCSLYFQKVTLAIEEYVKKHFSNHFRRWLLCATLLGLILCLFPPLFGEGYDTIQLFLTNGDLSSETNGLLGGICKNGWGVLIFFILVLLFKVLAMTLTNAGGGVGGTFGPTLFVGGVAGFVVARFLNLGFDLALPEQNFVLVGMAGLMAGVMQAPMTAIFLIAEITGGYDLFLPLIICSTLSFCTTRIWEKYSIYTKRIAQSGDLLTHDSDQAAIAMLKTTPLIRDKYPRINKNATLGDLVHQIALSTAAVFPVVDDNDHFEGLIDVDNTRKYILKSNLYKTMTVAELMETPPALIMYDEKMDSVMAKFDKTEAWRLPVVDEEGVYKGFISRSRMLTAYRDELRSLVMPD